MIVVMDVVVKIVVKIANVKNVVVIALILFVYINFYQISIYNYQIFQKQIDLYIYCTIQTNCCDNWQCCQCMQCCTAGDILTELNFNRHIELEDENETFLAQFKELISNYRIYKRYRHPLLEESFLLKKKKTSTIQFYDKIILKTYWFTNQNEYSKSLSVWHQNIFKYTEMQIYGARIQDICIDRWRIAVLLPKLHQIQKKHKFQVYTFLSQISSQILNYSEEKSIFNELLIYYESSYVLLPSNLLKQSIYEQYKANHKLKHPPEWEDENDQLFDWNKSDCFLMGLFVLTQLVNSTLDDVYEDSKFNKNKLNFYLQKINNQEFYNVLIYMLQSEPDERYSLQQILQLMKNKPITPITQENNKSLVPLQSTQKQQPISVVSRVQNQNLNTGGIYTGDQIDNKKHGHGKLLNPDGSGYEGEWFQDLMHGKGELFLPDGRILYKGQFQNGKYIQILYFLNSLQLISIKMQIKIQIKLVYHNFGHLINPNPNITQNYNFRDLRNIGNYWSKYEGDFKSDKKHGYGILYAERSGQESLSMIYQVDLAHFLVYLVKQPENGLKAFYLIELVMFIFLQDFQILKDQLNNTLFIIQQIIVLFQDTFSYQILLFVNLQIKNVHCIMEHRQLLETLVVDLLNSPINPLIQYRDFQIQHICKQIGVNEYGGQKDSIFFKHFASHFISYLNEKNELSPIIIQAQITRNQSKSQELQQNKQIALPLKPESIISSVCLKSKNDVQLSHVKLLRQ